MFQNVHKIWLLLGTGAAVALVLSACAVSGLPAAKSPLLHVLAPSSGRVAYIGTDGNVHIAFPTGKVINITTDGQAGPHPAVTYTTPEWSFNGKELAYARIRRATSKSGLRSEIFVTNAAGRLTHEVYATATLLPFYLYWSPNNSSIAVLSAAVGNGSSLRFGIVDAKVDGKGGGALKANYTPVGSGSPFYWAWAPNGSMVVAHTQERASPGAKDFIAFYNLASAGRAPRAREDFRRALGAFDAPAVSPDGRSVLVPIGNPRRSNLVLWSLRSGRKVSIATVTGRVSYSFSPNGRYVAFVDASSSSGRPTLHVVELRNPQAGYTLKGRPVVAFWWAPNSSEIAYVTPANVGPGSLDPLFARTGNLAIASMNVLDVRNRRSRSVADYPLTASFLANVPFNDQYQLSSTIWSPNSTHLLFTAISRTGNPGIFVAAANGGLQPSLLAYGGFASWSWR